MDSAPEAAREKLTAVDCETRPVCLTVTGAVTENYRHSQG
jgi:hypothetical protein